MKKDDGQKKRGVIYARYSAGPHQTDQSIEGQVRDCTRYADLLSEKSNFLGLVGHDVFFRIAV